MSRIIPTALILLALAGCASNSRPPSNAENACAILQERPDFARAVHASEAKWGVPAHVQLATMYQESSFRGDARPPRRWFLGFIPRGRASTAYGYGQALDGTWEEYQQKEGGWAARRDNIHHAADFMGWSMNETSRSLGISKYDAANQYLAYHEGRTGYRQGRYLQKPWLMGVAARVDTRSQKYANQLRSCRW
ncbi:transglycosylase SLT domain-containing protein [Falsirhodobacter xinxiangensis]|uniref:transglycosylase SLT domain-containing protein n=1 Tax=Falsirhodobacter xinxiangensis TaxID=2530049 RepID=UPI0010AA1299|nr:lytic transglycosylase [Rhodobacter xinxiangensis]